MATTESIMAAVRENRSSESNFERLVEELRLAREMAEKDANKSLADELENVADKYVAAYQQAKETGGTAWPEFEHFVTQFERALTSAAKQA